MPIVLATFGVIFALVVGAYWLFVSPSSTRMSATVSPSSSATTCASTVRVPVPMSCVPQRRTAVPSGLRCTVAYAGGNPLPPQSCEAIP